MLTETGKANFLRCPFTMNDRDGPWGCIGTNCAAWRFSGLQSRRCHIFQANATANVEPVRPPEVPSSWTWCPYDDADGEPAQWVEPEAEAQARRLGYCGLAGRPRS